MPSRRRFLLGVGLASGLAGCTGSERSDSTGSDATGHGNGTRLTADGPPTTGGGTATDAGTATEPTRETPRHEAVRWRVAFDAPVERRPAIGGDAVYVGVGEAGLSANGSDARSSGSLAALGATDGTPRWTSALPAAPARRPRVRDGEVYCVAGRSNGFHGVDHRLLRFGTDGTERWRTDGIDQFLDLLAVGGGRAYLGTCDDALGLDGQRLFAVGRSGGDARWSVETGDAFGGRYLDGSLLVGLGGRAVARHDAATGERQWQKRVEGVRSSDGSFVVADDAVLAGGPPDGDGRLAALDLADGSQRWTYAEGGGRAFVPSGAALAGDTVVGTEYDGRVFALTVGDGRERWATDLDGETRRAPVVADGTVFVGGYRSNAADVIHALDAETGAKRWRADVPGFSGGIHPTGETVVVRAGDGRAVRSLDAADGSVRWSFEASEPLSAPVVGDGGVYAASESGIVRKFEK
ncbi:PQQ-like beta-propeller repeat protein [Halorussus gelatinilyticus]|uniref:PQQ-like beta-propeller repeat protein n=1 Tax=Halorussus gelatinilyticus TaxID=2937524 RepID=A0A8U0IHC5_9EURY|nr:PQQ-binding-like beta-propeller repeat protein [Halorussus gelatinilyticus]UPV99661.1 PQQ-like beta-propeller repeat protein [Halorussus gelatinilyticus]